MRRRAFVVGAVGTLTGGTLIGSRAFSRASVERRVSIQETNDANAFFALEEDTGLESGAYSVQQAGRYRITINSFAYGSDGDVEGSGVNPNSRYTFDQIGRFVNQGTKTVDAWVAFDDVPLPDFWIYTGGDPDNRLNSADPVELEVGDGVPFGAGVDTGDAALSEYQFTMTIRAENP